MVLVPALSSSSVLNVALAPLLMASVRPAHWVPDPEPLAVNVAPEPSRVVPPPVQAPALQVLPVALSVTVPEPPSVPPVCVKTPATLVAPFKVRVPPETLSPAPKLLLWATLRLPPLICMPRPAGRLMLRTVWVPLPSTMVLPAVVINTSSLAPGNTPPPQLAVLVQVNPSPRPLHWPAAVNPRVRPVPV